MYQTINGHTLALGDVAFVREVKQDGCPVRKVLVMEENGPVLTLDTWSVQDREWMNQPVYADVRRLELVYRPEYHRKAEEPAEQSPDAIESLNTEPHQ